MKHKILLALALCLVLSGCGQTAAEVPIEPAPEATVSGVGENDVSRSEQEEELQRVSEIIPGDYDFTHDGRAEIVELVRIMGDDGRGDGALRPLWFELHISNDDGELLWSGEGHTAHAGYRNLFACTVDGQDYILDYGPSMGQGLGNYNYELFSLTREGEEVLFKENYVSFDVNFGSPIYTGNYDPAAIGAFMDDVHTYLDGACMILMSTDGSGPLTGVPGSYYRGDDLSGKLYLMDGTWEERFQRYRENYTAKG